MLFSKGSFVPAWAFACAVVCLFGLAACGADDDDADDGADTGTTADPTGGDTTGGTGDTTATGGTGDTGDTDDTDNTGDTGTTGDELALSVSVSETALTVRAKGSDTPVFELPLGCAGTGADALPTVRSGTGSPEYFTGFGSFRIDLDSPKSKIRWQKPDCKPKSVTETEAGWAVTWDIGGSPATVTISKPVAATSAATASVDVVLDLGLAAPPVPGASAYKGWASELSFACAPGEAFFGLGTQVTGMDLRGREYPLWTQEQGIGKPENPIGFPLQNIPEAAYAPMGVWHSSRGYAAVLAEDGYHSIDLCKARADRVTLRAYGSQLGFRVYGGGEPRDRMKALQPALGVAPQVPLWAFAPWNDAVGGPERIETIATTLRDNKIPSSAIWTEDWIGGTQSTTGFRLSYAWEWDPTRYPDLPGDIDRLHAQGFAFLAYFNPFVPEPTRMFSEGEQGGFLIRNARGETFTFQDPAFRNASMADLSNPAARDWLEGYLVKASRDLKIDGWMADFAEWLPADAVLASGEDPWVAHNRYPLDWQRLNNKAFEATKAAGAWTYFARSGWASLKGATAGIAPTMWGGDQDTDWDYDDGLPTVIPIATHAGLAGVGIFATDIAGYTSQGAPNTTKELFYRWATVGAFHPLMRTHHGSDKCGNWSFERDAETLAHYKRYARLHTRLFPTLFSLYQRGYREEGLPVMRHPYLVEPARPGLWTGDNYQFFVGDDVLVAPVMAVGATTREVSLPDTTEGWWPLFGGAPVSGAKAGQGGIAKITVDAPVTELPVFVRGGAALLLHAGDIDTFYTPTAETSGVTDLGDVQGRYAAALYPAVGGAVLDRSFELPGGKTLQLSAADLAASQTFAGATAGGSAVPVCVAGETDPTTACVETGGAALWVVGTEGGAPQTVTLASGSVTVGLPAGATVRLAIAGAAFGDLVTVPTAPDLNATAPGWCETE